MERKFRQQQDAAFARRRHRVRLRQTVAFATACFARIPAGPLFFLSSEERKNTQRKKRACLGLKKKLFLFFNAVIAVVFLAVIALSLDFNALAGALAKANLFFLLAAAFFYFLTHLASAVRYKALLGKFKIASYFESHMKAMLASDATPGRVGYSLFVFDMRKKGLRGGRGAKLLGVSLASDFLVRGLLALLAVWLFSREFGQIGAAVVIASLAVFALLFFKLEAISKMLSKIPFYGKRLEGAYHSAVSHSTSKKQLAFSIFASFVGAMARGAEWVFVFYALGAPVSLVDATVFSALLTALSFVPLSLSGLGLQEGGGVLLFTVFLGLGASQAAAAMILVRFVDVACDLLVGGWFFVSSGKMLLLPAENRCAFLT